MYVAVDEAGNGEASLGVDFFFAAVAVQGTDDGAAAHGDVAGLQLPIDQVEDARIAHH